MCRYCDINSDNCSIFIDPLTNEHYLDIETTEWDQYNDSYVHQREYINYCPYCGKKLLYDKDLKKVLSEQIFDNGKMMLSPEINSCDFHTMTHKDTEILGMFCDFTGLHDKDIADILLNGYLATATNK